MDAAAAIALGEVVRHLRREGTTVREATFVLFDQRAYDIHAAQVPDIQGLEPA
jgi:hypothetical protein